LSGRKRRGCSGHGRARHVWVGLKLVEFLEVERGSILRIRLEVLERNNDKRGNDGRE
jgi:hypothetical protein